MKKVVFVAFAACVALLLGCSKSSPDNNNTCGDAEFKLNEPFTLCWGNTAHQNGNPDFSIKFEKVVTDSRCPSDVICVWGGIALIDLRSTKGSFTQTDTLGNGDISKDFWPDSTNFLNYRLKLLEVAPYPVSTQQIGEEEYKIKVVVSQE